MTRLEVNSGPGFTPAMAAAEADKIERALTLLPDNPAMYGEWKRLVTQRRLQTFNVRIFTRFGIKVLFPPDLVS